MKVAFYPEALNENLYLKLIQKTLDDKDIEFIKVNQVFQSINTYKAVAAVHFNWYESISEKERFKAFIEFVRKCFVLLLLRVSGKRIVWTMHNKQEHDSGFAMYNKLITWLFVRLSVVIIIHSELSKQLLVGRYGPRITDKICHIPHPHYIGAYGNAVPAPRQIENTALRLLFLGGVRPYKNIELLIDVIQGMEDQVSLTIAGKPLDQSYGQSIAERCAKLKAVQLRLDFIEDVEIPKLIGANDLLVLPYDINSSLNSGSVILAASYARSVICPEIGTVSDFQAQSCLLTYRYSNPSSHLEKLSQAISKAVMLKQRQADTFIEWGKVLYHEVQQKHDGRLIAERLYAIYCGGESQQQSR